jgi:hypothetical protein
MGEGGNDNKPQGERRLLHHVLVLQLEVTSASDRPDGDILRQLVGCTFLPPSCPRAPRTHMHASVRMAAGACLNIAAAALHSPLCPGLDSPAILWAAEGEPNSLNSVTWAQLRGRCMQAAAAIAARFPPGGLLVARYHMALLLVCCHTICTCWQL